ncbi:uncharacterized protein DDB_G0271670-like isoform X3 [Scylla paramamosain]|uniref:uncharacterized protein DDB_G0271670-like isoform X3 n=1 Tax=Scylla paramamosain TaxID=85552 RepID=UPI003083516C
MVCICNAVDPHVVWLVRTGHYPAGVQKTETQMASDSDVEAYLNQLSRKTHHLKQNSRPWEDSASSVSGADHPPDDLSVSSDLSLHVDSRAPKTHSHQKTATGGLLSDITALSDKYSGSKDKKSPTKDKFSTLEEKYLRKYNINASGPKNHEPSRETKQRKNAAEKDQADKSDLRVTPKASKGANYDSSEDIDDENLAHYLSEVTLTSEKLGSDKESTAAGNSETNDSSDDVLNLKNVIDVEELLGEEEDSGRSLHDSPAHYSVKSDDIAGRNKPQPDNKLTGKPQSKAAKVSKDEQAGASGGANLFASSKSSLFYSRQKDGEEEEEEDEPHTAVRLLLPQAGSDVFHSSRRKSSLSFDAINEGKIKLLKPSKQTIKGKTKVRHKSASEGTIATASDSQISEQVPASEMEEDALSYRRDASGGTQESTVVSEVQENSQVSTSASTVKSERSKQSGGSKRHSISSQTRHSVTLSSKASHRKHQESRSSKNDESEHRSKSHKQSHHLHRRHHHHKARKAHKTSHRKHKETERMTRKSRKKHRSPSSSSSSSSSSESSSSTSEPSRRRSHSHKHSSRRAAYGHWGKPPFLQPGMWPCCCLYTAHTGHAASPYTLPPFTGTTSSTLLSGSGLGVEEVMQQQVALVRQFLDSQQVMYQAYTSTLVSSFRYTSLRRTEKYIKKRKAPLTFPEAYRLVKEEMEASER